MNVERKTAEEYRQLANGSYRRKEESFQRCDTDGFLSQWAHGLNGRLNNRKADLVEAGEKAEFCGLYEGSRRVKAKKVTRPNSFAPWKEQTSWLVHADDPIARIRKWIPSGKKSRIQKQLGLRETKEIAPAWCRTEGRGRGLSGECWITDFRTGDEWGLDAEEVK